MDYKKYKSEGKRHDLQWKEERELPRFNREKAYDARCGTGAEKQSAPGCASYSPQPRTPKREEYAPNTERHK